jgi:hypothetical protein
LNRTKYVLLGMEEGDVHFQGLEANPAAVGCGLGLGNVGQEKLRTHFLGYLVKAHFMNSNSYKRATLSLYANGTIWRDAEPPVNAMSGLVLWGTVIQLPVPPFHGHVLTQW